MIKFFIIELIGLIIAFVFSIWETSLLEIKKWKYLQLVSDREEEDYPYLSSIEAHILAIKNLKNLSFLVTFTVYMIFTFPKLLLDENIICLLSSFFLIYFIPPIFIKKESSYKLIRLFIPIQLWLSKIFPKDKEIPPATEEEKEERIEAFLLEGKEKNIITEEEEEMVEKIIYFKERTVREIMTPRINIIGIEEGMPLSQLKKLIIEKKKSRILVYRERIDNLVGIVIAKDMFRYWGQDSIILKKTKDLIRKPLYVTEYMRISDLLKLLQKKKQKMAVVTDEYGGISGVVTVEDILEEIVGEIYDEYEKEEVSIEEKDGYYIVSGDTPIEDIEDLLDTEFEIDHSAVTIGGMISYILGKFPNKGEKIVIDNYEFEIKDISEKSIKKIIIRELKQEN